MSFRLPLTADGVYLRAGTFTHTFSLAGQVRPARPWDRLTQFGLLLFWPKAVTWLRLFGTAAGTGPGTQLASDTTGLDAVCAAHACLREQVAPAKFLERNNFLTATLPQNIRLLLTVEVDTDNDDFRRLVRERRNNAKGELVQPVHVVFFDAKQFGNYVQGEGVLDLVMKPCAPVPRFAGVLAVDLGNTSTTAAALSEADPVYKTASVKLVPLDGTDALGGDPSPLPSVLRLDRIRSDGPVPEGMRRFPELPGDDRPNAVSFVAGELAAVGAADGNLPSGVVFGAKQLLTAKVPTASDPAATGPGREPSMSLVVTHVRPGAEPQPEAVEVLNRLPGELLFTHAVRGFRRAACSWPADLVLTYPTTYSPRELRQLTQAAARGWLRAMGQSQDPTALGEPNEDPHLEELSASVREWLQHGVGATLPVGLTLDEATAAAFFHLYRRVFEQPGGMVRFRYLFPQGLRVLLIDCGGGTTDVALVHAVSQPETPTLLEIDVLARTGLRGFGGDAITREACRLIKAKLLCLLARGRPVAVPPPLPALAPTNSKQAADAVLAFLAKSALLDPADELLPTRFDPKQSDAAAQRRRTCFQSLWQLAEAVKFALARGRAVKLKDVGLAHLNRNTSPLIDSALRALPPAAQVPLLTQLGEVSVAPWEIDALVRAPVASLVSKCNRLIREHLTNAPGGEREVDWIVISGNGARYPLVGRMIEDGLIVPDARARVTIDAENMKHAVAKGAAMARMVERVPRTLGIKFNRHLSELLPFDVGYHNMITNSSELLFTAHTPYTDLATGPRNVRLVPPGGSAAGLSNTFVLERRFPGDDAFEQYAAYRFPAGISGEVRVWYDPATGEFQVTDVTTEALGELKDLTEQDRLAVAMRGDV